MTPTFLPRSLGPVLLLASALLPARSALGAPPEPDTIVITATRTPEAASRIPASVSVVEGSEVSARGASDLGSALATVGGVEAPPGGDAGPSSAVPSFLGLHEFDAFLLVVDGVPWGGAFNPAITTLDFTNLDRIEVLKGAAPVMYGATSFVGVVHFIHRPAGEALPVAELAWGSFGSLRGNIAVNLPAQGALRQSLSFEGRDLQSSDPRARSADGRMLYRALTDLAGGALRLDAGAEFVRDLPVSPVIRQGGALTAQTPLDANFNPADARIDTDRVHATVAYTHATPWGSWETLGSYANSRVRDVRAFLHPDLSGAADTQDQVRNIDDWYLDSHLASEFLEGASLVAGADLLGGWGRQTTRNGNSAYTVPLDGSVIPPPASAAFINEVGTVRDRRVFAGAYAQWDWKPDDRWDISGGARWNQTGERKQSSDFTTPPDQLAAASAARVARRLTASLGASARLWARGDREMVAFADIRNAMKPAAIDFGPDYTPDILAPETARAAEAGLKGSLRAAGIAWQVETFAMHLDNLVVATPSGALANAAGERLHGFEAELRWHGQNGLTLLANASWHQAQFTRYEFFDGNATTDVSGRDLPLSPRILATAGALYTPHEGPGATAIAHLVGRRYLDEANSAAAPAYATLDATASYSRGRWRAAIEGSNLTNRRPPVTASEFGSESFYLLPGRVLWLRFSLQLGHDRPSRGRG